MNKKGQIALFVIFGIMVLIAIAAVMFFGKIRISASPEELDTSAIEMQIGNCLRKVAEEALFEKLGKQGGYMELDSVKYDEVGDFSIAYHYYGGESRIPPMEKIKEDLKHHVEAEIDSCMDFPAFEKKNYKVMRLKPEANVDFNEEAAIIELKYPMTIKSGNANAKIERFTSIIPVRFKKAHEIGRCFVEEIKDNPDDDATIFISKRECLKKYDDDSLMSLAYAKDKYILIYDYKTWEGVYGKTFKYLFAVDFS